MTRFKKGYKDDVGIDICLDFEVQFKPFETKIIDVGTNIQVPQGNAVMMCARTSAAKKGIIVNQCPIDPGYTGNIHIIAHNCSNDNVTFKKGEAFAQLYCFKISKIDVNVEIKKQGARNANCFGSTDKE